MNTGIPVLTLLEHFTSVPGRTEIGVDILIAILAHRYTEAYSLASRIESTGALTMRLLTLATAEQQPDRIRGDVEGWNVRLDFSNSFIVIAGPVPLEFAVTKPIVIDSTATPPISGGVAAAISILIAKAGVELEFYEHGYSVWMSGSIAWFGVREHLADVPIGATFPTVPSERVRQEFEAMQDGGGRPPPKPTSGFGPANRRAQERYDAWMRQHAAPGAGGTTGGPAPAPVTGASGQPDGSGATGPGSSSATPDHTDSAATLDDDLPRKQLE